MNREIKFRQWSGTKMDYRPKTGVGGGACINDLFDVYGYEIDNILTQFTGLKDKNGKEIYEGDILKDTEESAHYKCIWDRDEARYDFERLEDGDTMSGYYQISEIANTSKVIGNIYQNPELLKD